MTFGQLNCSVVAMGCPDENRLRFCQAFTLPLTTGMLRDDVSARAYATLTAMYIPAGFLHACLIPAIYLPIQAILSCPILKPRNLQTALLLFCSPQTVVEGDRRR